MINPTRSLSCTPSPPSPSSSPSAPSLVSLFPPLPPSPVSQPRLPIRLAPPPTPLSSPACTRRHCFGCFGSCVHVSAPFIIHAIHAIHVRFILRQVQIPLAQRPKRAQQRIQSRIILKIPLRGCCRWHGKRADPQRARRRAARETIAEVKEQRLHGRARSPPEFARSPARYVLTQS